METPKNESESKEVLEAVVEGGTDFNFTTLKEYSLKRFKKNLNLKLFAKLYIEFEKDKIAKHIRLLKKTNRFYEELNKDLASAKSEEDAIAVLGKESELVKTWLKRTIND